LGSKRGAKIKKKTEKARRVTTATSDHTPARVKPYNSQENRPKE